MFLSQFHYSVLGTNESRRVVFIHGLMAFAANWRKIAGRLEADFQCLIYDQRGHGRSFKPETGYTAEIFAEDLNKITDELGWEQFHLVGHSMGGRNAMVFAHLYPEKVKTLTIEDMGPEADSRAADYYAKMLGMVPAPFASKEEMKNYFENTFKKEFKSKEPIDVLATFLQANFESDESGQYNWKFSKNAVVEIVKQGHVRDRWLEVSQFKMPVLWMRGENSHILSRETFEKMGQINSHIQCVEVPQAGHWVHYEKPEAFVQIFRDFIKQYESDQNSQHNA